VRVIVVTVDQRGSREASDAVDAALEAHRDLALLRPLERTAGDEFQGVLDDPAVLTTLLERLLRSGSWHVGVGAGEVETPLPDSTRAGRGPAYVAAREAVTGAKSAPWRLRVAGDEPVAARRLESAVWLWAAVLDRRSLRGWEVADLVDTGLRYDAVAQRLGISQSAVSQRAAAAGIVEGLRARELVTDLAALLLAPEAS
jgi:hypothetical protein